MELSYALQQFIGSYLVTVTAAVTFESPRKFIWKTGFIGAIGYLVSELLMAYFDTHSAVAMFVGCVVISTMAQYYARKYKAPATTFLIPSFYPLVPGSSIYQTAFYFIEGNFDLALNFFIKTVQFGMAIALGVFVVDSFMEINRHLKNKRKKN